MASDLSLIAAGVGIIALLFAGIFANARQWNEERQRRGDEREGRQYRQF